MDSASSSPLQLISPTKSAVYDYDHKRYHRYTDTCLFYPSALSTRRKRKEGYMRRYSTSSIESSQTTVTNRSIHRKALSLSTFQLLSEQGSKATIVNNTISNKLDYLLQQEQLQRSNSNNNNNDNNDTAISATTTAKATMILTKDTNNNTTFETSSTLGIQNNIPNNTTNTTTTTTTGRTSFIGNNNINNTNNNTDLQNAMATRHSLSATRKTEPSNNTEERQSTTQSPQPHETIEMTQRVPSKAVRIERDYSRGDGITRFCTEFPPELSGRGKDRIDANQLCHTIERINAILENAEKVSLNVFDNIMECLTLYIWPMLFSTHYLRSIKQLVQFIDSENDRLYHSKGISIANPVRHAFLFIEIRLYD
ncbi:Golgin subfamily A member 7/ERF4 family-domain-containing protein [Phascolomyces articulosus]|uniref:Ras modification protein ERF4 n=1 Tax=Phascolomyces articulosus TaxID=60185 RepID=A0AAD5K5C6_9FUNG|nr:Golgin subfamily A member 7/ERF4 family-domain-containing protein [Phascolomyces articulosus]